MDDALAKTILAVRKRTPEKDTGWSCRKGCGWPRVGRGRLQQWSPV